MIIGDNKDMLTVQPNLVHTYNRLPAFGQKGTDNEYFADYEIIDTGNNDSYDLIQEEQNAKKELDLWNQTKQNLDSIAKTTESVPALNKGMKIFSGLISVAIGWGGLRWGTAGTLKILSDIGKTRLARLVKSTTSSAYTYSKGLLSSGKNYVKNHSWYLSVANAMSGTKESFLKTTVGQKLVSLNAAVKNNPVYNAIISTKDNTVTYMKKLNPKRIFVETMGAAGGGTALVNVVGGKPVDGANHDIQPSDNGYIIDGQEEVA